MSHKFQLNTEWNSDSFKKNAHKIKKRIKFKNSLEYD